MTPTPQADLFGSALPFPAANDDFARFHRESRQREAEARRKGVCRAIGAERHARRDFTLRCLKPQGT